MLVQFSSASLPKNLTLKGCVPPINRVYPFFFFEVPFSSLDQWASARMVNPCFHAGGMKPGSHRFQPFEPQRWRYYGKTIRHVKTGDNRKMKAKHWRILRWKSCHWVYILYDLICSIFEQWQSMGGVIISQLHTSHRPKTAWFCLGRFRGFTSGHGMVIC